MTNRSANTIPAKPVTYANTPFKSTAEARWAVLFDALNVPWRYEPERFRTGRGGYVPDFQLPTLGVWWGVKGAPPTKAAQQAALSVARQSRPVCLAWGPMAPGVKGQVWCVIAHDLVVRVGLAQCVVCGQSAVRPLDEGAPDNGHVFQLNHPDIEAAFTIALQAGR